MDASRWTVSKLRAELSRLGRKMPLRARKPELVAVLAAVTVQPAELPLELWGEISMYLLARDLAALAGASQGLRRFLGPIGDRAWRAALEREFVPLTGVRTVQEYNAANRRRCAGWYGVYRELALLVRDRYPRIATLLRWPVGVRALVRSDAGNVDWWRFAKKVQRKYSPEMMRATLAAYPKIPYRPWCPDFIQDARDYVQSALKEERLAHYEAEAALLLACELGDKNLAELLLTAHIYPRPETGMEQAWSRVVFSRPPKDRLAVMTAFRLQWLAPVLAEQCEPHVVLELFDAGWLPRPCGSCCCRLIGAAITHGRQDVLEKLAGEGVQHAALRGGGDCVLNCVTAARHALEEARTQIVLDAMDVGLLCCHKYLVGAALS